MPIDSWLDPKEVAGHFGLKVWSAYGWINSSTIPEVYLRRCGRWRFRIHPDVVPHLEKVFREARE